jgi:16S rRNA (guanine(966)-N(2))-methyltransferase RsmD
MRIISGIYKGRKLISSDDYSIRPTTDRVKEYIFNVLHDFPQDRRVADIFAGSGNLGLEALSRGATHITFVEVAAGSVQVLRKNLDHIKIPDNCYLIERKDAMDFAKEDISAIELFLLDPPFVYPPLQELINNIFSNRRLNADSLLVVEHEINNPLECPGKDYELLKQRKFGRSLISFLQRKVNHE